MVHIGDSHCISNGQYYCRPLRASVFLLDFRLSVSGMVPATRLGRKKLFPRWRDERYSPHFSWSYKHPPLSPRPIRCALHSNNPEGPGYIKSKRTQSRWQEQGDGGGDSVVAGMYFDTLTGKNAVLVLRNTLSPTSPSPLSKLT